MSEYDLLSNGHSHVMGDNSNAAGQPRLDGNRDGNVRNQCPAGAARDSQTLLLN